MKKCFSLLFGCIIAIILTGCGFHLRGYHDFPPKLSPVYVQPDRQNQLTVFQLNNSLKANNIPLTQDKKAAKTIIHIVSSSKKSSITALTGGAEAGEYRIMANTTFNITNSKGKVLIDDTTVMTERRYNSNATQRLSGQFEANTLYRKMHIELAQKIINHLTALD